MVEEPPAVRDLASHEYVADNRHAVDQRSVLIDRFDADPLAVLAGFHLDRFAVGEDLSGIGFHNPRHQLDHRRFAGAIVAQQAYDLALIDVEVEIDQRLDGAVAFGDSADLEERRGHARRLPSTVWLRMTARTISAPTKMSR